jgi:hypothetical protein
LEGIEKEVKEVRECLEIIPARLEVITVGRREKGMDFTEMTERRNFGLVEETGRKIGVVEVGREMEVEAMGRRIGQWSVIGSGERGTKRRIGRRDVALEGRKRKLVKVGQVTRGGRTNLGWIGTRTRWRGACSSRIFEADGDREEAEGVEERERLGYCRLGQRNTIFLRLFRLRWSLRSQWTRTCRRARIL